MRAPGGNKLRGRHVCMKKGGGEERDGAKKKKKMEFLSGADDRHLACCLARAENSPDAKVNSASRWCTVNSPLPEDCRVRICSTQSLSLPGFSAGLSCYGAELKIRVQKIE
ncbi:hypothetical protein CEXT_466221 [Caerostris extrusa]|uniref:Uncharacterized protein n=1 Tax=Caerostris extrusa TaxID=172846 RepID=A0AAV4WVL0_CAEEX|nr:hypothetical protein CEXT_466221 [Caerostris extrusa]